jgi:hypothetical protein
MSATRQAWKDGNVIIAEGIRGENMEMETKDRAYLACI